MTQRTIKQSELNRLVQQLEDLRQALRPFAVFAAALPPVIEGQPRLTDAGPCFTASPLGKNHVITFADLRHAKALLERLVEEDVVRHVAVAEAAMTNAVCKLCGSEFEPTATTKDNAIGAAAFCSATCYERHRLLEMPP